MSVLIKGLKMPKRCGECIFDVSGVGGCIINLNTEPKNKLTHSCPLIELPDHGDLIDRDELMMKMWGADAYASNQRSCNVRVVFVRDIETAPVVIPAERSEDE